MSCEKSSRTAASRTGNAFRGLVLIRMEDTITVLLTMMLIMDFLPDPVLLFPVLSSAVHHSLTYDAQVRLIQLDQPFFYFGRPYTQLYVSERVSGI